MPVEAPPRKWIELYDGLELLAGRLLGPDGKKVFTLRDAADMDIDAFNRDAEEDVRMKESDTAFVRFLKYAESLSRAYDDGSFVPTRREYIEALLAAGIILRMPEPDKPMFWTLFSGDFFVDVTTDVIEIIEQKGDNYLVQPQRFDENWELRPAGPPITIATNGWIREIDPLHGYPTEVSEECGPLRNIAEKAYPYLDSSVTEGRVHPLFRGIQSGFPGNDDIQYVTHHPGANTGALCMGFYPLPEADTQTSAILLRSQQKDRSGLKSPFLKFPSKDRL
jgi:hypothetical protein